MKFFPQVLDGNNDQNTRVDNHLNPAVTTRFVRFKPVESATDDMCMRVAVFKCRRKCSMFRASFHKKVMQHNVSCWAT